MCVVEISDAHASNMQVWYITEQLSYWSTIYHIIWCPQAPGLMKVLCSTYNKTVFLISCIMISPNICFTFLKVSSLTPYVSCVRHVYPRAQPYSHGMSDCHGLYVHMLNMIQASLHMHMYIKI